MRTSILILLLIPHFIFSQETFSKTLFDKSDLTIYETFDAFEHVLNQANDTVYVVNFWATWCKPCVAELPYFEELTKQYEGKPVKVLLVSLDFERQLERKLIPFINKNQLQSEVIVLTDSKSVHWIDRVSEEWSGSIPATYIYKNEAYIFLEQEFESSQDINQYIIEISKY